MKLTPETVEAVMLADQAIEWAMITSHMEITRMKRHSLTYVDLHPEPVQQSTEPSTWLIWLGAAVGVAALCALVVVLFTLGAA